jgi:hypothetical protein
MSPAELTMLNLARFQRMLDRTSDPQERARIEQLVKEERAKNDSAYPLDYPPQAPRR